MRKTFSMNFEIERGRLLIGRGRLLFVRGHLYYGRDVHFSATRENIIGSNNSLDILKTDADVNFIDADVYIKIRFGRQISVELHFGVRKSRTVQCYSIPRVHF